MKKITFLFLIFVFFLALPVQAQGTLDGKILPEELRGYSVGMTLSPDGQTIVRAVAEELCLSSFPFDKDVCTPLPEALESGPSSLRWSPDGHYVAININLNIEYEFWDTDLWVYDVVNDTFIPLTQDDIVKQEDWFIGDKYEAMPEVTMDIQPVWHPDGDLYFFRIGFEEGSRWADMPLALYRADIDSQTIDFITDIDTGPKPEGGLPLGPYVIQSEFSEDGSTLAFLFSEGNRMFPAQGPYDVFTLDMDTLELNVIAEPDDYCDSVPDWLECRFLPVALMWADDGLVIEAGNHYFDRYYRDLLPRTAHYFDGENIRPLFDFSNVPEEFGDWQSAIPLTGVVIDNSYVYAHYGNETFMLSRLSLPDGEPQLLFTTEEFSRFDEPFFASRSAEGHILVRGYYFTFEN